MKKKNDCHVNEGSKTVTGLGGIYIKHISEMMKIYNRAGILGDNPIVTREMKTV